MTRPDATELLTTARCLLLEGLLPALPSELGYEARMIASALAMAAREIELGPQAAELEEGALAHVLEPHGLAGLTREDARALLSQFIREGVFDRPGPDRQRLLEALGAITRARLRISNPKVLDHDR
ncbi:DUF6285 domain-containing protein [Metapseudomonas furukawaii]|uniref:DUF6285 domain-containing protein n=1 Tax=Metapseudomonas furukawaii TaxID=1149133 RepID=UPI00404632E3